MFTILIASMSISLQGADSQRFSHLHLPIHGTLHKGFLYGFFANGKVPLGIDAFPIKNPMKTPSKSYQPWPFSVGYSYRHIIRKNGIWISTGQGSAATLKFEDLEIYEAGNKNKAFFAKKYPGLREQFPHSIITERLWEKYGERQSFGLDPYAEDVLDCGTYPTSETICKCYILTKPDLRMQIWDMDLAWDKKKQIWKTAKDGQNLETIHSAFSESFFFFFRNPHYYFVTQSGKLYYAPPRKAGQESRIMQELWWDAKRPIVAVIEDADQDKVWLFAKDKNRDAKFDLFFEMKETVRYELFDPAKLRPVNVEGRARVLLEYLPLIRREPKK